MFSLRLLWKSTIVFLYRTETSGKFSILIMKTRSCLRIANRKSTIRLKHDFLSYIIATSSMNSGKKKCALRFLFNFTDLMFIISTHCWLKTLEILKKQSSSNFGPVNILQNLPLWITNMIFESLYDNYNSPLIVFLVFFRIFQQKWVMWNGKMEDILDEKNFQCRVLELKA